MPSQANKAFITVCEKTYNKKINGQCYSRACKEDQRLCHDILQYSQGAGSAKLYGQMSPSSLSTLGLHHGPMSLLHLLLLALEEPHKTV